MTAIDLGLAVVAGDRPCWWSSGTSARSTPTRSAGARGGPVQPPLRRVRKAKLLLDLCSEEEQIPRPLRQRFAKSPEGSPRERAWAR